MLSSPLCDLAPELQTSEILEEFMKHAVLAVYLSLCHKLPQMWIIHPTCLPHLLYNHELLAALFDVSHQHADCLPYSQSPLTLEQAMKAQRGSKGIALLFL
jgi:hypothetical protein